MRRKLGLNGPEVSPIGLGCFGMSHAYGEASEEESIGTIRHALDLGCNLLDTADEYGAGENERLLGRALKGRRTGVVLASKFGFVWNEHGEIVGINGRPEYVRQACEASLQRLNTDYIDVYYLHRIDPQVPIEETVGGMAELVRSGQVRYLGLSEAQEDVIRRAHSIHRISALQSEYSLWARDPERAVIPTCRELGIGFVAFSPLGRGFFTGQVKQENLGPGDFRKTLPRFQKENFNSNLGALAALNSFSRQKGCSSTQLALAWLLAQGDDIVAIPGTRSITHFQENFAASAIHLTAAEINTINEALSADRFAGARYAETSLFRPNSPETSQPKCSSSEST